MSPRATHDMYLPDRRAARTVAPRGARNEGRYRPVDTRRPRKPRELPYNSAIAALARRFVREVQRNGANRMPLKEYEMECPDCETVLTLEMEPATDDPEEAVECPKCHGEFDWAYDLATDTVTLVVAPEEEEEEEEEDAGAFEDEEEEDDDD